jgi:NitT/TauT family transport system ATP-binding protein
MSSAKLRIGFIPLVDAAALLVAADMGFATEQGLDIELVREVSWSNVRDKLNIGLFDAAHLLAPMAVASSLGIGHVRVPIVAPFNLGINGNAITVSPQLFSELSDVVDGDIADPRLSSVALRRIVAERKLRAAEPLTFGVTFPFSHHNYQLRYWMAAGGVDPDDDVRLVVLPPPYMVESLASGHVDGFCVGAPWSSVAVDAGIGRILHFGCEIQERVVEKVFAVRERWAKDHPDILASLVRALAAAAEFVRQSENRASVSAAVADRLNVDVDLVSRTLAGDMTVGPDGQTRANGRHLMIGGNGVMRPDAVQASWIYAQIVRWGQASPSEELLGFAQGVFRPDLYDAALGATDGRDGGDPHDGIGAFTGPLFDDRDIAGYLAAWRLKPPGRPWLSVVR